MRIRPLWWNGDESEEALTCNDEYFFGDKILVAPMVQPGEHIYTRAKHISNTGTTRDVYIPPGTWLPYGDSSQPLVVGPKSLKNQHVRMSDLLFYTLQN